MNLEGLYTNIQWLEAYAADHLGGGADLVLHDLLHDIVALAEENEDLRAELDGLRPIATALGQIRKARTNALLARAGLGPRGDD